MITRTKNFSIPFVFQGQVSKDASINQAFFIIDTLLRRAAISITETLPESPVDGEIYITTSNNKINIYNQDYLWHSIDPKEGAELFIKSKNKFYAFINGVWSEKITSGTSNAGGGTSSNSIATFDVAGIVKASSDIDVVSDGQMVINKDFIKLQNGKLPILDGSLLTNLPKDDTKVDKITGKNLSTEDFTTAEKTKLAGIANFANNVSVSIASTYTAGIVKASSDILIASDGKMTVSSDFIKLLNSKLPSIDGSLLINLPKDDTKVDKITGKILSTEDFTTAEKTKLSVLTNTVIVDNLTTQDPQKSLSANQGYLLKNLINSIQVQSSSWLVGDYKQSAKKASHGGWLICEGQAISRSIYSALFTEIGTSFGIGDGSATFNLPDFRGRVFGAIGKGDGLTNRAVGVKIGEENHLLTIAEMPNHNHDFKFGKLHGSCDGLLDIACSNNYSSPISSRAGFGVQSSGGGASHNNIQPTLFAGSMFVYSGVI